MRIYFRLYLLLLLLSSPAAALQNQLQDHASPYLAMHGGDPVAWQDWGAAALELARKEDKLLFISSGYFSCHWCHVMQQESYQNNHIAKLLNEHYIPVKLDRELHPALDAYLIDYLETTQGHAGWPLNIFLTPEGYPLIGATYLPTERFGKVLQHMQGAWDKERSKTRNLARRALLKVLAQQHSVDIESVPAQTLRQQLIRQALTIADQMEGGFGEENKFPMEPQLLALLQARGNKPHKALDSWMQLTLNHMASQGLRDQLGGGFYRYTVDPSWQTPHYEKMLYNQAQLSRIYLLAGKLYQHDHYLAVARDTLDFALREMRGPQGGLIASFSAIDEAGNEGGVYLWQRDQLEKILCDAHLALARRYWGLSGMTEYGYLPRQVESIDQIAQDLGLDATDLADRVERIRQRLLSVRAKRKLPADNKELAAWNGLMISALAIAAGQLEEPRYRAAAESLRDFIQHHLWQGDELWRARQGDKPVGAASLADYVYVAEGMHYLAALTRDAKDAEWRDQLIKAAWRKHYGEHGWRSVEQALLPGMGEQAAQSDGALFSAPAMLIRLSLISWDPAIKGKAADAIRLSRRKAQQEPFWYASHVMALLEQ